MERLNRQRAVFKGTITRVETFINRSIADNNIDVCEFEVRQNMLNEAYVGYSEVQGKIEDEDDSEVTLNDRADVETRYLNLSALIKRCLKKNIETNSNLSSSSLGSLQSQYNNIKVPEISIPVFSGKFSDWSSFYDLFNALIVENTQFSDIQRFIYLKSSLKGEPLKLVENLPLTNDNFKIALNILKTRYENKLFVVNAHIKALVEIPSINRCTGPNLREFITTVKQHAESLKNLSVPIESWDLILIYLLMQRLDFQTKQAFEFDRGSSALPTLKAFLDFLEKRCIALENLGVPEGKGKFINLNTTSTDYKGVHTGLKCNSSNGDGQRGINGNNRDIPASQENTIAVIDHNEIVGEKASLSNSIQLSAIAKGRSNYVMLATTQVCLLDRNGRSVIATALLDSGAQCSLITTKLAERLLYPTYKRTVQISGISGKGAVCNEMIDITLSLKNCKDINNKEIHVSCSVLDRFIMQKFIGFTFMCCEHQTVIYVQDYK
ncbi:uncharacterized protein LOC112904469 [Agrilus planipennis]|uniref:Uncharacterized protein LOC112904469 n=1 Tax=Agrilus planipennis TaxID=224129 RepID=A0A7F5QYM1_AGRPL|nr:uncharacterized protein LOC112904469 [Agrilus planipennis]